MIIAFRILLLILLLHWCRLLSYLIGRSHTSVSVRVALVYGYCFLLSSSLSHHVVSILCSVPKHQISVSPAVSPTVTFCIIALVS